MASTSPIQSQSHPIPIDIRRELLESQYWTPWKISPGIFAQMTPQKERYKKVEVLPTDPEWRFVWRYFYHDKPNHWGIGRIYCVHERHQQKAFELTLSSIEREVEKFKPTWDQEPRAPQRAKVIERWREAANIFSPFHTFEADGRKRNWEQTKILPLWHGTSKEVADSVAESGFVFFGKTSLGKTSSDPKSTDEGFFGSGIYFSNSARYVSDIYSSGHILMAWVSMREPFPVVGDPAQQDMATLQGKGAYKHYNAHYVPVTSINPVNPYEAIYYPAQPGDIPHCDEVVVFQKSQTLPRFWIELAIESPTIMSPSNIPQFVEDMIPHLFQILGHQEVDKDKKLRNHLNQELAFLLKLPGDDYLEDHGDKYETLYGHMMQLIVQGKVNRQISRLITGSKPPQTPPVTPLITQQFEQIHLTPTPPSSSAAPAPYSPYASYPQSTPPPSHYSGAPPPYVAPKASSSPWAPQQASPVHTPTPIYASPKPPQSSVPAMAFGKAKWEKYFGDVGVEPPLPKDIVEVLKSPCPYWSGKRVEESHLLILIPQTINGKPFTLNALQGLTQNPRIGNAAKYSYYDSDVKKELGDQTVPKSYWTLITKDVLPNSRSKTYSEQQTLIKGPYAVPGALEIATGILMYHVQTGERLYSDSPNTYTRCQEKVCSNKYRVVVGSFGSSGLYVYDFYRGGSGGDGYRHDRNGLGGVRKF